MRPLNLLNAPSVLQVEVSSNQVVTIEIQAILEKSGYSITLFVIILSPLALPDLSFF